MKVGGARQLFFLMGAERRKRSEENSFHRLDKLSIRMPLACLRHGMSRNRPRVYCSTSRRMRNNFCNVKSPPRLRSPRCNKKWSWMARDGSQGGWRWMRRKWQFNKGQNNINYILVHVHDWHISRSSCGCSLGCACSLAHDEEESQRRKKLLVPFQLTFSSCLDESLINSSFCLASEISTTLIFLLSTARKARSHACHKSFRLWGYFIMM